MVTGLQPLEFKDCQLDSPEFRENLNKHEKVLEKTSQQIKRIIKEVNLLLTAAKNLSRAQRTLSKSLDEFNFECIGSTQTDDEQVIVDSLKQFSKMIANIEDERDNMLARAHDQIVVPLEDFRIKRIGGVKENKKKFDKKTAKFCKAQELFLNMSSKKPDNTIQEADASLGMLEREYLRESLSYVLAIQDVQERIKFEFVETLLGFMSGWMVFYHWGHDTAVEAREYMTDLQHKVQKTRENFDETQAKAEELKAKYMDSKMKPDTEYTKQGYLFLMEKSKLKAFTATWSKYYCTYKKQQKQFTMQAYNQMSGRTEADRECLTLVQCTRKASEFEKRYCFDLTLEQKPNITLTFQALCEEDRKSWLNAMDGKEPTVSVPGALKSNEEYALDDVGFAFARKCIEVLEHRGLEEEGLYRIGGVNTKITKLITLGMDRQKTEKERLQFFYEEQHSDLTETKTIASALKHYLRNLNEPLMTYRYHNGFIAAAKQETRIQRISDVHTLIHRLSKVNFEMLEIVIRHLKAVSMKCPKNKMSVFNLGVVFGPTLLRAVEETLAAILDIKFNNVVIEILIENYELIFKSQPGKASTDYLTHSSPPEPVPRSYGGYRSSRNSLTMQPVVRVVARSNYTDSVMSSSLQNIPNGLAIYQNTGTISPHKSPKNHHHPIYDTKPPQMNQSTPSLNRDLNISGRPIEPTYVSAHNNHHSLSPNHHRSTTADHMKSHSNNHTSSRDKILQPVRDQSNASSHPMSRSTGDGIYAQSQRLNPSTYSENNLTNSNASMLDRINSTSSSNESVCSTSSLSHPLSYTRHGSGPPHVSQLANSGVPKPSSYLPDYVTTGVLGGHHTKNGGAGSGGLLSSGGNYVSSRVAIVDEASQGYMPKKTQRSKESGRQSYNSPRDNVRVRTLYACLAENDGELSFEPNQIITNVRSSNEPGWLDGTLNGKSGLIPENYVEILK